MRIVKQTTNNNKNSYEVSTRLGRLVVEGEGMTDKDAIVAAKYIVSEEQKGMNWLEKILFKRADELDKVKGTAIVKAYNLPTWIVKIPPKLFQVYAYFSGIKIVHTRDKVEFYKWGQIVGELEMMGLYKKGEFRKYE